MCDSENLDDEIEEYENLDKCPECKTLTIVRSQDRSYEYCAKCGLITRASYNYQAGIRFDLPYGLLIL